MISKEIGKLSRLSRKILAKPKLKFSLPNKPTPTYAQWMKMNKQWLKNTHIAIRPIVQTELKTQLDKAMDSSVWSWPNVTHRVNGTTVSTPRNIVDTGYLKSSLSQSLKKAAQKSTFVGKYRAKYAIITHYGGRISNYGRVDGTTLPGRPWIKATFEGANGITKFDVRNEIEQALAEEFRKIFG